MSMSSLRTTIPPYRILARVMAATRYRVPRPRGPRKVIE
nr:hypothetical protein JVH1_4663 [Rhodococcus sp. JVH1]